MYILALLFSSALQLQRRERTCRAYIQVAFLFQQSALHAQEVGALFDSE